MPPGPMRNFTPASQEVLALARQAADTLGHKYVGTEHLLLALLKRGETAQDRTGLALIRLGLDYAGTRTLVEQRATPAMVAGGSGRAPLTPHMIRALATAGRIAERSKHESLEPSHLALALTADEEGLAGRMLREKGVTTDTLRTALSAAMGLQFAEVPRLPPLDTAERPPNSRGFIMAVVAVLRTVSVLTFAYTLTSVLISIFSTPMSDMLPTSLAAFALRILGIYTVVCAAVWCLAPWIARTMMRGVAPRCEP